MKLILFFISLFIVVGCHPYIQQHDPWVPSPILRTPSGKILECTGGNLILHPLPQKYAHFKVKNLTQQPSNWPSNLIFEGAVVVTWVSSEVKDLEVGDIVFGAYFSPNGPEFQIRNSQELRSLFEDHLSFGLQLFVLKQNSVANQRTERVILSNKNSKKTPEKNIRFLRVEQAWDETYLGLGFANLATLPVSDRPRHLKDSTVVIHWVAGNTIASRKGVMPLDALVSIDGQKIYRCEQAVRLIRENRIGRVQLKIRHPNHQEETIEIDSSVGADEMVVQKIIPALYGKRFSQKEYATSFLGIYSGMRYHYYPPENEDRLSAWSLAELTNSESDILYSPKPEYFQEHVFNIPLLYYSQKMTSLENGHGYERQKFLSFFNFEKRF